MILPSHPRRRRNEILSSWMLTVAAGNVVSVLELFRELKVFDYFNRWTEHLWGESDGRACVMPIP